MASVCPSSGIARSTNSVRDGIACTLRETYRVAVRDALAASDQGRHDRIDDLRVPPGCENAVITDAPRTPVQRFLDDAGIPWRRTRAEAIRHAGVSTSPCYDWPVVAYEDHGAFGPLIEPLASNHRDDFAPHLPAPMLSAMAWTRPPPGRGAARANLDAVSARIAKRLGPPRKGSTSSNVLQHVWGEGPSRLTLTVWPPALQRNLPPNPAHEREPRLAESCSIAIETGWRLVPTAAERAALAHLRPIDPRSPCAPTADVSPYAIEFEREPYGLDLPFHLALGGDGTLLVSMSGALRIVEVASIRRLRHVVLLPARGGGRTSIEADVAIGSGHKTLTLTSASRSDALDAVFDRLAHMTGIAAERVEQLDE